MWGKMEIWGLCVCSALKLYIFCGLLKTSILVVALVEVVFLSLYSNDIQSQDARWKFYFLLCSTVHRKADITVTDA